MKLKTLVALPRERLLGPAREVGERLRAEVRAETGLAVSVGIAPVKMVAKIASDAAKPDGLCEVEPARVREFLDPLPVGRLWGVGPVTRGMLERAGTGNGVRVRFVTEAAAMENVLEYVVQGKAATSS